MYLKLFFHIIFSLTSLKIITLSNSSCTSSPTGSPISTPSHSPLPRTPTTSTPVHSKQSSSSVLNNPYIIVDKPGQVIGMASSSAASTGTRLLLCVKVLLEIGSGPEAKWGSSVWATHIEFKNGCEDFTVQQNRSWTIPSRLYLYFGSFVLFYSLVLSYLALYSLPSVFSYISLSSLFCTQRMTCGEPAGWLLDERLPWWLNCSISLPDKENKTTRSCPVCVCVCVGVCVDPRKHKL